MKRSASAGTTPVLLRLLAGVDLDEELRRAALPRDLAGDDRGKLRPVDGVDGIEEGNRVGGLVGLEGTDEGGVRSPHAGR